MKRKSTFSEAQPTPAPPPRTPGNKDGSGAENPPAEKKATISEFQSRMNSCGPGFVLRGDYKLDGPKNEASAYTSKALSDRAHTILVELLARAYEDEEALFFFYSLLHTFTGELPDVLEADENRGKNVAGKFTELPCHYEDKDAKDRKKKFGVGARYIFDALDLRHVQRKNLWTRYAEAGVGAISANSQWLRELGFRDEINAETSKTEQGLGSASHDFCTIQNSSGIFHVPKWCLKCFQFPLPIPLSDKAVCVSVWEIIREAVLEYWLNNRDRYEEALRKIASKGEDTDRRNKALKAIQDALVTLLRCR